MAGPFGPAFLLLFIFCGCCMFDAGEIITLQPGTSPASGAADSVRPDWSPMAQPPDPRTGIMAHTPDPTGYHDAGGRTMLPRATQNFGSRGFSTEPGIVHIDPSDPVRGTGGISVDLGRVTKQSMALATEQSGGNPVLAWQIAGGMAEVAASQVAMPAPDPRMPPPNQPGYVLPQGLTGGGQLPAAAALNDPAMTFAPTGAVQNPSVKPPKGKAMSVPQMIPPAQPVQPQGMPVQPAPHPHAPAPPQVAPVATAPPSVQGAPLYASPQPQPQPYYPPQPQPPAYDPVQAATMEALQGIMGGLQTLNASINELKPSSNGAPSHVEEASQIVTKAQQERLSMEQEWENISRAKQDLMRAGRIPTDGPPEMAEDSEPELTLAVPENTELAFLTEPPSRPRIPVVFNLGKGGQHLKRFHHVAQRDIWLSLIYDGRHEGDQFIPPVTGKDDPPIEISFPDSPDKDNNVIRAIVPKSCNMKIGCMDIINFIIVKPEDVVPQRESEPSFAQQPEYAHLVPEVLGGQAAP